MKNIFSILILLSVSIVNSAHVFADKIEEVGVAPGYLEQEAVSIPGHSFKVATTDEPCFGETGNWSSSCTWTEAKNICSAKNRNSDWKYGGSGWFLPTMKELVVIWCHNAHPNYISESEFQQQDPEVTEEKLNRMAKQPESDPGCKNSGKSRAVHFFNQIPGNPLPAYWSSDSLKDGQGQFLYSTDGREDTAGPKAELRVRCIYR